MEVIQQWPNVAYAFSLMAISLVISLAMKLKLTRLLFVASIRCLLQLTCMALILQPILDQDNYNKPWHVASLSLLALVMIIAGTVEVALMKAPLRYKSMLPVIFLSLGGSCLVTCIIGTGAVMQVSPFYTPQHFIPILGMLLGNSISSVTLAIQHALREFHDNADRIEILLSFGATKWEASLPTIQSALRTGMLPTLNAMSVQGLVAIPGMMTGQIIAGAAPLDAVKYQQIVMFLIATATALSTVLSLFLTAQIALNAKHQVVRGNIYRVKK